jgi:hypothetical protein
MSDQVFLPMTSCRQCPHLHTEPDYTADSWERPEKWFCDKEKGKIGMGKLIARYVEWNDKTPIPSWCPLREKA